MSRLETISLEVISSIQFKNFGSTFAGITVGYTETAITVIGSAGITQLTVAISVPDASATIEGSVSFFLLVTTSNNMTTGWCILTRQSLLQSEYLY